MVTHFGLNVDEQINAAATVLNNISDNNCVLMGDFNLQPDSRIIKSISSAINDTASVSDEPLFTFPSDKPRVKIDYIFVSKDIRVKSVSVPEMIVSDHRPVIADVELQI
ncbi:MAG: endonuclease/exonuclease/phosphatase family protein [Clostridia bacterium]|nr:endonuclease/exonuclease/phosphatase family protein [Clostridia bacterium]